MAWLLVVRQLKVACRVWMIVHQKIVTGRDIEISTGRVTPSHLLCLYSRNRSVTGMAAIPLYLIRPK
jgi:hypothetical protein